MSTPSSMAGSGSSWEELRTGPRGPADAEARLALHHAIQPVAAVGQSLAAKAPDDSQQSLSPQGPVRWLGVPVGPGKGGRSARAGIDAVRLALQICDGDGAPVTSLRLEGRTLAEALAFLQGGVDRFGLPGLAVALPEHAADDFPSHAVGRGAPFADGGEAERAELARLFAGTSALLAELRGEEPAPIRIWPHHFDLAAGWQVGPVAVGLGVSPGEGAAGQPYWYATLSPAPPPGALPPLEGGGRWRSEGWSGAELPVDRLVQGAAAQRAQVAAFYRSALAAARR